jgi:hypothetical protein
MQTAHSNRGRRSGGAADVLGGVRPAAREGAAGLDRAAGLRAQTPEGFVGDARVGVAERRPQAGDCEITAVAVGGELLERARGVGADRACRIIKARGRPSEGDRRAAAAERGSRLGADLGCGVGEGSGQRGDRERGKRIETGEGAGSSGRMPRRSHSQPSASVARRRRSSSGAPISVARPRIARPTSISPGVSEPSGCSRIWTTTAHFARSRRTTGHQARSVPAFAIALHCVWGFGRHRGLRRRPACHAESQANR